jgi:acyl-coenzyme A thioesterase PaaI-like protein
VPTCARKARALVERAHRAAAELGEGYETFKLGRCCDRRLTLRGTSPSSVSRARISPAIPLAAFHPCRDRAGGETCSAERSTTSKNSSVTEPPAPPGPALADVAALLTDLLPAETNLRVVQAFRQQVVFAAGPEGMEPALGGAVSGPSIFKAVDLTAFMTVNACIRRMPAAVLAQSSISFLEAAQQGVLELTVDLVQVGIRSAVTTVQVRDGRGWLVALATLHFALPTRAGRAAVGPSPQETPFDDRTA